MTLKSDNWSSVEVTVDARAVEAVEFALNGSEALGTEINLLGRRKPHPDITVIGYFKEKPDEENFRMQIADGLRIHGCDQSALITIRWCLFEDADWLAEWKKHWKATRIGKFIISPPWEIVFPSEKIVIYIEPNMAFGTGTHETTQLCLQAIGDNYNRRQTFLDVGTGTGILAIAVAKFATESTATDEKNLSHSVKSTAKILACDTDIDSIRLAKENANANGVGDLIEFADGTLSEDTEIFDFVCANLTIDVIVPILPLLIKKSRSLLLLSGILIEQQNLIEKELKKFQISNAKFETAGEWISVTVRKEI